MPSNEKLLSNDLLTTQENGQKGIEDAYLLETAWEVCNQVGGIYTVIRSKIASVVSKWGNRYCLIGPLVSDDVSAEFEDITHYEGAVGKAVKALREQGLEVRYGRWLVTGKPMVVLVKPGDFMDKLDDIKQELQQEFGLEPRHGDHLYDQVLAFGEALASFMRAFSKEAQNEGRKAIAHFHEWMSCLPIARIKREKLPIPTVFTTHATLLGRYLAMNDPKFYTNLPKYDWEEAGRRFGIYAMAQIERIAAHDATTFTTVSEVTSRECKHLLGKEPVMILPNGLNIERFVAFHEVQNLHQQFKEEIHHFVMGHFFHSYPFDLDKTLYFFTSGRYEYRNKGYDVVLEALSLLNKMMKKANMDVNVVTFFITKRPTWSINPEVLQSRAVMEEINQNCDAILKQIGNKFFHAAASSGKVAKFPDLNQFVDEYWRLRYRRAIQSWKSDHWPIIVTHNLVNDMEDEILGYLRNSQLLNSPKDNVKVVYHPDFITPNNPLFGMEYGDFVRGCHLGIFPSYYEPWGYTPLECIARGIPTVTSDLSGFGDYVANLSQNHEENGVYVLKRYKRSTNVAVKELANFLFEFVRLTRRYRMVQRSKAEDFSEIFDWRNLGSAYERAYVDAVKTFY